MGKNIVVCWGKILGWRKNRHYQMLQSMTNNPFIHNFLLSLPLKSYTLTKDNYNKSALWWEEHLWTGPLVMVTQDDQAWEGFKASVVLSSNPNFSLYVMTNYLTRMMDPIMNYQ